ncbi:cupin domain-containing protein [Lophiotrema nucula]|uniref:Cupin domain-containing protein n=1 Tax=Lophiotrema nucula TaxID=690887 RepID=A0A6A5YFS8_9PLEO|nr:cupin domain-containing protein [Lophiotrema nucula]
MPSSKIFHGTTQTVLKPTQTFTGEVFVDRIHAGESTSIANVTFTPCARSYWHTHEGGQMLRVLSGTGWICDKGQEARRIKAGDVIWAEPGTTHWHGADEGSIMTHFVVAVGKTEWHGAVSEEDYKRRTEE